MTEQVEAPGEHTSTDGRLRRGDTTRRAVLERAVNLASVEGLDGLSIGRLSGELAISKSGLFAHFGSKEELQLATIRAARAIYGRAVVTPAMEAPEGLGRVLALLESWLDYSQRRQFPGGCFFAKTSHEYAARPGAVRDALAAVGQEWLDLIARTLDEARAVGEIDADPHQLAFELNAFLEYANLRSLLGDDAAYERARRSIRARLSEAATTGSLP